ncbi:MAG: alkaline phosphatase [Opitutaceae bacterium]|nr:alkaline phosphatase [Opitutaceae bacterium]
MSPQIPRREFLRVGATGSLIAALGLQHGCGQSADAGKPRTARNVIFLVSDGMSLGTLVMADALKRLQTGQSSHWLSLYAREEVRIAKMLTASASSSVTDSAAASSAFGGGTRVANGSLNIRPDGTRNEPILRLAKSAGLGAGLVTTATITHATPAGFVAQVGSRGDEEEVASQYLEQGVDVLLGGGSDFFDRAKRKDGRDLLSEYSKVGYSMASSGSALSAVTGSKCLGLFSAGHMPYSLDLSAGGQDIPSLAQMTRHALTTLSRGSTGFVLQVEGARIDHAAHANDVGALLRDQLAFDEALGEVIRFVDGRDDTLVLLTSDHGNANPGLNGTGAAYSETDERFAKVAGFRQTNTWVLEGLSAKSTDADVRTRVQQGLGLQLLKEEADVLVAALRSEHRDSYRVRNAPLVALGQVVANHCAVGWTGVSHTSDPTELVAFGPGSEGIRGLVPNTYLYECMVRALDLRRAKAA